MYMTTPVCNVKNPTNTLHIMIKTKVKICYFTNAISKVKHGSAKDLVLIDKGSGLKFKRALRKTCPRLQQL